MTNQSDIFPMCKIHPIFHSSVFDDYVVSVDFCSPVSLVMFQNETETTQKCDSNDFSMEESNEMFNKCRTNGNICSCLINIINDICMRKINVEMDALLFSCVMLELQRSRKFRSNILLNFYAFSRKEIKKGLQELSTSCPLCKRITWMVHVTVYLSLPKKNIVDYKWCKKIEVLVNEKCELENAMAWLSTLGGAFSALGDHFVECAEKAGLISIQQFQLALRLGDPLTICRCKIYLAMSLLQREYYSKTKRLIQDLYKFSTGPEGSKDFRLKNMCIAVWNRLKYVLSLKKARCVRETDPKSIMDN